MFKLLRKLNRKKLIVLGITSVILLIIAVIGFTYGYYSSFVRKVNQSNKITVTSGKSQITYIASLTEEDSIEKIKPGFTSVDYFAVQNTGTANAMYFIYLENVINSFISTEDITYSLYRTKGTDNINFDFIDIDTLDYTTWELLINNEIYPTTDGLLKETKETIEQRNEYYIYAIVINYKYRLDKDQSIDSDHIFGGHIKLIPTDQINTDNAYEKGTLAYEVINNSILNLNGTKYNAKSILNLEDNSSSEPLLSVEEDDYGISYYYRGNVIDNFINFNNMCWKIIRIEGDGSIKLSLYDTNICSETNKDNNSPLIKNDDIIIEKNYLEEIKIELNNWYNKYNFNLLENKLKLDKWCTINTEYKYDDTTNNLIDNLDIYTMTNKDDENNYSYNYYTKKSILSNNRTLKCGEFNNTYDSYIGLLNIEEILYNSSKLINQNYNVATLTLSSFHSKDNSDYLYTYSLEEIPISKPVAINPVITLISGTKYLKGNGTINSAYEVQ